MSCEQFLPGRQPFPRALASFPSNVTNEEKRRRQMLRIKGYPIRIRGRFHFWIGNTLHSNFPTLSDAITFAVRTIERRYEETHSIR